MKDYLETLYEDTSITMHASGDCDCYCCDECGYHSSTVIHEPTGISNYVITIIRENQLVIECPVDIAIDGLKKKIKSYTAKKEESERFNEFLKDRRTPTAEMFGYSSNIKKDEKPLHPGTVASWLLCDEGYKKDKLQDLDCKDGSVLMTNLHVSYVAKIMGVNINKFSEFVCGDSPIDYLLAYKLVKLLPHTSMDFWMDLQESYDRYMDDSISG